MEYGRELKKYGVPGGEIGGDKALHNSLKCYRSVRFVTVCFLAAHMYTLKGIFCWCAQQSQFLDYELGGAVSAVMSVEE